MNAILFGGSAPRSFFADLGLTLVRIGFGAALAYLHGWGKTSNIEGVTAMVEGLGFPAPKIFAYAVIGAEVGGGALLAAGLLTRLASLSIVVTMGVAIFMHHAGDSLATIEPAALFGLVALAFLFSGSGRLSLDAMFRRRD